jgi:hypothetical protein
MPNISTGSTDFCKGNNNNYQIDAVEGVAQTFTISTFNPGYYWYIAARTNCNFSAATGLDDTSVTVTPVSTFDQLNHWGFAVAQFSSDPGGSLPTDTSDISSPGLLGYAYVFGSFTRASVTDSTYGVQINNSLGNTILDINAIYPRVFASGGPVTLAPEESSIITVPGLIADGTHIPFRIGTGVYDQGLVGYNYTVPFGPGENGKLRLQNFSTVDTITLYWLVATA